MGHDSEGIVKHRLLWGVYLGLAVVASTQLLTWMGLGLSHLTWISSWALTAVFAVLAARSFGRRLGERPGFPRVAGLLLVMILVGSLIYQTYMYLYINFVDPTWVDTVAEVWSAQLAEAGVSAEEIETGITRFRARWETPYVFTLGLVGYSLPPFLLGLVAATLVVVQPWKKRSAA